MRLLPPHHANFAKRLVKTPKLFFLDTGLLCYLLGIRSADMLETHPLRGSIFETLIVSEMIKSFTNIGEVPPLYFWRDRTGHEVDVVVDAGNELIPVEIKAGATVTSSFLMGSASLASLAIPHHLAECLSTAAVVRLIFGKAIVFALGSLRYRIPSRRPSELWSAQQGGYLGAGPVDRYGVGSLLALSLHQS